MLTSYFNKHGIPPTFTLLVCGLSSYSKHGNHFTAFFQVPLRSTPVACSKHGIIIAQTNSIYQMEYVI